LAPLGARVNELPLTPERIEKCIERARANAESLNSRPLLPYAFDVFQALLNREVVMLVSSGVASHHVPHK
jgi:hypothetical protein